MPGRPLSAAPRPRVSSQLRRGLARCLLWLLLGGLLAGCTGSPRAPEQPPAAGPSPVGAAATTTRGAELRAALTYLLTDRVQLALAHARALQEAGGEPSALEVVAARRALERSGEEVVEVLTGSYADATEQLGPAVRGQDRALLTHTAAVVEGDEQSVRSARDALDAAQGELAATVRRVVPGLRAQDVEAALAAVATTTLQAVAAVLGDSVRAAGLQRAADEAAWSTARLLAVGVSTDRGLGLAGSPATELRGRLTGLLTEHVLLSGELAVRLREVGGDLQDAQVRAIEAALDAAAVSLADLMGRTVPETALPVLTAWREHLREVRDLAAARAAGRPAPAVPRDYLQRLQAALSPHADDLPLRAGELGTTATASLRAAVEAAATGSAGAPELLRAAAQDTVAPAALLSASLAEGLGLS